MENQVGRKVLDARQVGKKLRINYTFVSIRTNTIVSLTRVTAITSLKIMTKLEWIAEVAALCVVVAIKTAQPLVPHSIE